MGDEINDEELQELLAAADNRRGADNTDETFAAPLSYDFKRPQRVNKDQSRTLENIHEHFVRFFSSTLASSMRMVVDVDLAFTDQAAYGEFVLSLPNPCSAYTFFMDPPGGYAVLSLAPDLVMAIIDRAFGGKGQALPGDGRPLTHIERNVIDKVVTRVFNDLEATWEPITTIKVTDVTFETNPEFIQVASASEPVIVVAFEAHCNNVSSLVHLCYPIGTLDHLLPKLDPQKKKGRAPANKTKTMASLQKTRVPVVVQIAHGNLPLGEVANLQKDDVIKLDTAKNEPAVIFIGGQPKFLGRPGLQRRKRAIEILSSIGEGEENLYL
jgi:flagellar motor switch protein FliM